MVDSISRFEIMLTKGSLLYKLYFFTYLTLKDFIFPDKSKYRSYGYGWVVTKGDESIIAHSGSWVGFRNYVFRNVDSGVDIIMFSNRGSASEDYWFHNVMKKIDKTILSQ